MLSISPPALTGQQQTPHEETPVLSLTHFSRPPFLSFGCVRPGSARSAVLLLQNPSADPAQVTVQKLPRNRGFSVPETEILVPPFETVPLTITWTPLEEGGIRELVTFVLNDIVKHQAVLLGRAELPTKKKRTRWNAAKKKHSPVGGKKVSGPKMKDHCLTGVKSKTFSVTQKSGFERLETARGPLQPCENLSKLVPSTSHVREPRLSTENRLPTIFVSPHANELQDVNLGSLRRSKTYPVLCTTEDTTCIRTNIVIDEEWTLTEHMVNKISISPINPVHCQEQHLNPMPSIINDLITYSPLSPDEFYKAELAIKHDDSEQSCFFQQSSHERCTNVTTTTQTPPLILSTPRRITLSPDSFVNDIYISDKHLNAAPHTPILSPDQFVKENYLTPYSLVFNNLPENSIASKSPVVEVKTMQFVSECVDKVLSDKPLEDPELVSSRLTYCVKKKQERLVNLPVADDCPVTKGPVKPFIVSATVTKVKAGGGNELKNRPQLKSRRRLRNIELEGNVVSPRVSQALPVINVADLPVISVSVTSSCSDSSVKVSPAKSICGHKRKSEEISNGAAVTSSESLNVASRAKRSFLPKPSLSQDVNEQEPPRAREVSLPLKAAGEIHKLKIETIKAKPTFVKSHQTGKMGTSHQQSTGAKSFKRVIAVPQSKLTFISSTKTVIPRHPMPFAAKNMFYDERWIAKQERGFTWWLNFILTPDDFAVKTDSMKVNAAALILGPDNHKVSVLKAPTKEEVSLKAYTARCRLNRLRRSACRLFTSDPVVRAIRRLEVEIEARRLLVRKDRHLWKDVGERQKILNWLLSYNPLWLRIGLETIFGELISLESNSDVTGLALFILNRLLWNPDIAAEYRHPSVPHLYRDGHEEALSKFTLKKLLLLVFFLDYAKQNRLIDHDPCLFCKDAEFKTSKELLLAFSRDFLSGEGDLSRHLSYLGLPVCHTQTPLDEFDFAVTNLAVDLQCGVRLVRTMELLTENWNLSKKLRVPAISRLQKMHNVEVALQVLTNRGAQIKDERGTFITSKDIVDRHRERTLALLWNIVFTFQVNLLLHIDHLKEEIQFLKHSYNIQKKLAALRALSIPTATRKRDSEPFIPENYSERVLYLMEWVNAVCAFYSTKVENFTVSFSDGRVFCYLINHYHPSYVPLNAICQRTTQTIECNENGTAGLNSFSDSDNSLDMWPGICDQGIPVSDLYKELLENERTNFSLVQTAVSNLGGIPAMIHHSDMSNTIPDEKIVITFLSYLCARFLDICKEARAARVIQGAWRKYKLTSEEQLLQKKHKAARVIQLAVRKFLTRHQMLKRVLSAVVIQKHWRRYLAHKQLVMLKTHKQNAVETAAAVVIQRHWRGYGARKYYRALLRNVVLMQARVRANIAVVSFKQKICAVRTLQMYVRSWLVATTERESYLQLKTATLVIQLAFRRWKHKRIKRERNAALVLQRAYRRWRVLKQEEKRSAAIAIQSMYRMSRERCKYLAMRAAAIKIQSVVKMRQERINYVVLRRRVIFIQRLYRANYMLKEQLPFLKVRQACVIIQCAIKGYLVRKKIKLWHKAATTLQANYRMHRERKRYLTYYRAALVIQERFQAHKECALQREIFCHMKQSIIQIQAAYRGYIVRKRIKLEHVAAISIQSTYRCYRSRKRYVKIRQAALTIQWWYAGQKCLKREKEQFVRTKTAATTIQAAYHGWKARKELHKQNVSAIIIQSTIRRFIAQKGYQELKKAILTIQKHYRAMLTGRKERQTYLQMCLLVRKMQAVWRGRKVRMEIQRVHQQATLIQSYYRMHVCHHKYKAMKQSVQVIQCRYRAHIAGKAQRSLYLRTKAAVTLLQAAYRGWKTRKNILELHKSAGVIQASYRSFRLRKQYLNLRMATISIQRWYRAIVTARIPRAEYIHFRRNVLKLQSMYRGMKARQKIMHMHKSAILLQSVFKMYEKRAKYQAVRKAAVLLQRRYRAVLEGRKVRKCYVSLMNAACTMQAAWRGRKLREQINGMHMAATVIQSQYRMFKQQQYYKRLRKVTIAVQQRYRASLERNRQMRLYNNMRSTVFYIQSAFRVMKLRQELRAKSEAASIIQRAFRSHLERRRFLALKRAAVTIQKRFKMKKLADHQKQEYIRLKKVSLLLQAAFRGLREREKLQHLNSSATFIQAAFRMHKTRVAYQMIKCASVTIQRHYKAYRVAVYEREMFLKQRRSAITIQAAYRGAKVRQKISELNRAASKIQSTFRMHLCRRYYREVQWAVSVIQQRYRANRMRDSEVLRFCIVKNAALCIQASYRGWHQRKELKNMKEAAMVIQRQSRTYLKHKRYHSLRAATIRVQRRFRATVRMRPHYHKYQSLRKAAICIQASYRGFKVRKAIELKHTMATRIQSAFRMHRALVLYKAKRDATFTIQTWYRSVVNCKRARASFLKLHGSVIIIQAGFRGMRVRKHMQTMNKAATLIQSTYRMYVHLKFYMSLKKAARTVQQRYRERIARDRALYWYQTTNTSAVSLQAAFMGMEVRRQIQKMHHAATIIQTFVRSFLQRRTYLKCRSAAVCLQRKYRALVLARSQRLDFLTCLKAAVCIQSAYRGHKVRVGLEQKNRAATTIQSMFRMHRVHTTYQAQRASAIVIQRYYRSHTSVLHSRECHLKLRYTAIVLQATYRGMRSRKSLTKMHDAATVIQTFYRMYRQKKSYLDLKQAAIKIQLRFKANILRDKTMEQYNTLRKAVTHIKFIFRVMKQRKEARRTAAALVIQAAWKMHQKRRTFVQTKTAVVIIQAAFRGHRTRKRHKLNEVSACHIQKWFRRCRHTRLQRAQYLSMRASAIVIQSTFRGSMVRKLVQQERAARTLQSYLRMAMCRRRFLQLRVSTIKLQSYYRMHRTVKMYQEQRTSAVILQQWYKSLIDMRRQRTEYLDIRRRVICVQAEVRRFCAQRRFTRTRCAIVVIQAHWRRCIQRKLFLHYKFSALTIQQNYRAYQLKKIQRSHYRRLKTTAIVLQSMYKGFQTRKLLREEKAACVIQRFYRCCVIRRNYITLTRTVRTLQTYVRAKQERARFVKVRKATVRIQRRWRETIMARNMRQLFLQKQASARILQSIYRGHIVRREIEKKNRAAHVIQVTYRGFRDRCRFLQLKAAAVTLQSRLRALHKGRDERHHYMQLRNSVIKLQACVRGWLVRKQIAQQNRRRLLLRFSSAIHHHLCAVKIQRCFRAHCVLKRARNQMDSVIFIQRWYRSRVQHRIFLITQRKVIFLQHVVRAWLYRRNEAATNIQRCVRDFLQRRRQAKLKCGIVKFQALWRGYQWRKSHDTKVLKKLRKRLQKVNEETKDEHKLCNRTLVALNYLLTYKHLSYILAALQHLEVATRLSSVCCENMAQSGAVNIIFTLIRSCNRSIPCMEVIKLSIQVLLNLSKYERTVLAVYEVNNSVESLLDLMQIYREKAGDKVSDKGGSIFTKTCCLLAIFALNSQRAREIRAIPKAMDRICSIYRLTARKHKMDTARNLCKQLMSSTPGHGFGALQATPIRTRIVSRIKPDWVLRKDNMREIVDPLKAIQMVIATFGMTV
ncbi:abnormal spindle-like microcephaly-associated protein [Pseudophryne corroboree]|uniref:abnormal spindle-like microcephaly-associated protein n=1 Tax=Pseudophryne corroboree TaxID=495146 RepID=UPI0030817A7B